MPRRWSRSSPTRRVSTSSCRRPLATRPACSTPPSSRSGPPVFFYPKSCLNDPQRTTSSDVARQFVPIGPGPQGARRPRHHVGRLGQYRAALPASAADATRDGRRRGRSDRPALAFALGRTCGAGVGRDDRAAGRRSRRQPYLRLGRRNLGDRCRKGARARRHAPRDSGRYLRALQLRQPDRSAAPRSSTCSSAAAELLDIEVSWTALPQPQEAGVAFIEAVGSGPSDETVEVVELVRLRGADACERGDAVATLEATKSVFELTSPLSGVVDEVLACAGDTIAVGDPLVRLHDREPTAVTAPPGNAGAAQSGAGA